MQNKRCILIGSSPETDISVISHLMHIDDYIICADGGYIFAEMLGIDPDLIVGDFDSSKKPENCSSEIISLPTRKDDTDMFYAVKEGIKRGCTEFIMVGATGGRLDHTYANFCALKYIADREIPGCIVDAKNEIHILNSLFNNNQTESMINSLTIQNKVGYGFGIFPFGCAKCTVSLSGFEYNVNKAELTSDFPLGVSNRVINESAKVYVHSGCAIIILEVV